MTYTWPLPEGTPISQPFGSNPNNGVNPAGGHTGTDFAVPVGTPVRAIGDGVVKFANWATTLPADYRPDGSGPNPYWLAPNFGGIVVVIDHGPVVSVHAHLSQTTLNAGDTVTQGQVIALSGDTGGATSGPHLHFETLPNGWDFQNGTYGRVDPATFCTAYWSDVQLAASGITPIPPTGGFLVALTDAQQQEVYDRLAYIASPEFKNHIFAGGSDVEKQGRQAFLDELVNHPFPWHGFDGNVPTDGRTVTNIATSLGYSDTWGTALANLIRAIQVSDPQAIAKAVVALLPAQGSVDAHAIAAEFGKLLNPPAAA